MCRFILLFLAFTSFISLCQENDDLISVEIQGNIFNTKEDSVNISQFYGTHYIDLLKAPLAKNGDFSIKGRLSHEDFYVVRLGNTHINVILKNGSKLKIYGDGSNLQAFSNIVGSDESSKMNEFIKVLSDWNAKQDSARIYLQQNPDKQQEVNNSMQREYTNFQSERQNFIAQNSNSPALLPVLSAIDPSREFPVYEAIVTQLMNSFSSSPTINNIHSNFLKAKEEKEAGEILAPGKIAPDFVDTKTDGTKMSLSDLRGNVVLLDFWASWCGPCRKENPNVVKLYKHYQKDGFTVMSVSLDQDKEKWINAIQKDGLIWPNHVSDLTGWKSASGKKYQVSGIPFTVLIDREGKIIRTNLRGLELEAELARIFGY